MLFRFFSFHSAASLLAFCVGRDRVVEVGLVLGEVVSGGGGGGGGRAGGGGGGGGRAGVVGVKTIRRSGSVRWKRQKCRGIRV